MLSLALAESFSHTLFMRQYQHLYLLLVMLLFAERATAQEIYPMTIYPGDNILSIRSTNGIEKITWTGSSGLRVSIPEISRCPQQVNIRVAVATATANERIVLTVYDCTGRFKTFDPINSEQWDVRREYTGLIEIGKDTCLPCQIITTEEKVIDSITTGDSTLTIRMPPGRSPWVAPSSRIDTFNYQVCFSPNQAITFTEQIRLHIRRKFPNGGLTSYVVEKPITAIGVAPLPPPVLTRTDSLQIIENALPPLVDPTTFRTIIVPTAETLDRGEIAVGSYDIVGLLGWYGIADNLTLMVGGSVVPEFISQLAVGSIGLKYRLLHKGNLQGAIGAQVGISSSAESDITVAAPYAVFSYGDRASRLSVALGYAWKRHTLPQFSFDRNAAVVAVGGDITLSRGWKLAAETYYIESSGLVPVVVTVRWFTERLAIDAGFGIDLGGDNDIRSTGPLSGEIRQLRIAPVISAIWRW